MKPVRLLLFAFVAVVSIGLVGAMSAKPPKGATKIWISNPSYGTTTDGKNVVEYTMTNARGMEVKVITYGGIIESVKAQGRGGRWADVVLGLKSLSDYETKSPYFGAIIGRFGNRIGHGMFTLNGTTYCLDLNNQPNGGYWVSLHGGYKGFDKQVWEVTQAKADDNGAVLQLHYLSPAGDGWTNTIPAGSGFSVPNPYCPPGSVNGYPGNLDTFVTYTLNNQNQIVIDYSAKTDADTVLNLTNHSYFNLGGESSGDIYGEMLKINGSQLTPVDQSLIPTGAFEPVAGTPFDFTQAKSIGQDIRVNDPQLLLGPGFDHNWVLNPQSEDNNSMLMPSHGAKLNLAATLFDKASGRTLDTWTTEPGLQFYAGNFLMGTFVGIGNHMYRQSDALTLETQHYPDSPNQPSFPTTELKAGQTYTSETIYAFSSH